MEISQDQLRRLEDALGFRFRGDELVSRALTHTSFANEHPPSLHQEPLAFLGDAALGLVVAEMLFDDDPGAQVGVLTPRRAEIVSGSNLARWAATLEVGGLVRLGRGEDLTGGRARESILATTLEAILGAIYLDSGLAAVRQALDRLAKLSP